MTRRRVLSKPKGAKVAWREIRAYPVIQVNSVLPHYSPGRRNLGTLTIKKQHMVPEIVSFFGISSNLNVIFRVFKL